MFLKSRNPIDVNALNDGMVPVRKLEARTISVKDVSLLIEEGIVPVRKLYDISSALNFVRALIVSGIGPINLLLLSLK